MDERVLITGGAGFLGLHLATALLDQGANVTLLDNFFRGVKDEALAAVSRRATVLEHDLSQPLTEELLGTGYSAVYHLAAVVGVRYSNDMPLDVVRNNLLTTINVLDWCAAHSDTKLCFASSSEVYAGTVELGLATVPTPEAVPLTIADPLLPRFSYATSKIAGEVLCTHFGAKYGFPVKIVRYHNIYGPRMGSEHVVPQFIQRVLARQDPFPIYGAAQRRAFCYISDAVRATLAVMSMPGLQSVCVNIGNDQEEISIADLARKLFDLVDFHPSISTYPPPPGSIERRCPDLSLLRGLTGYEPHVDLHQGLHQTLAWYAQYSS